MQWNGSNSQLSTGTTINNTTDLGYLHSDSVSVYLNSTSSGVFTNNGSILNETNNISGNPAVFVNLTGGYKNAINNLGTISAAPSSGYNTAFGIFVGDTFGGVTTAYTTFNGQNISSTIFNQVGGVIGSSDPTKFTAGIYNDTSGILNGGAMTVSGYANTILNAGTIQGTFGAIVNDGTINNATHGNYFSAIYNATGANITGGILNDVGGNIGTNATGIYVNAIENHGTITASSLPLPFAYAIYNAGNIGDQTHPASTGGLLNASGGLISGGIYNDTSAYFGLIENTGGTISGGITNSGGIINGIINTTGGGLYGTIDTIANVASGLITGQTGASSYGYAITDVSYGNITGGISNDASSSIVGGIQVDHTSTLGSIANDGVICAVTGGNSCVDGSGHLLSTTGYALDLENSSGPIAVSNAGTVSGNIYLGINNLTNTGQIIGNISNASGTINLNGGLVSGNITGTSSSALNINADNSFSGSVSVGTATLANGISMYLNNPFATISGFTNNGTLIVNNASTIVGPYIQSSTGSLQVSLGATQLTSKTLSVTGPATLNGNVSVNGTGVTPGLRYVLVYASSGLTGTFASSTLTGVNGVVSYDADDAFLTVLAPTPTGPSTANTQQSLANNVQPLQGAISVLNTTMANSFTYDCTEFGDNNVCISAGGRNTAVSAANGLNNTSALLIAAYRPHPSYRIGAYADQNLSMNNAGSTVNLGNNTPLVGLFGAWNEHLDGTGTEVKVSVAYGQKNATVIRSAVGAGATASEVGNGSAPINSQGAQATAKYGFGVAEDLIVSPYLGMRYTQNNMGGYSEQATSAVTEPLTYSALNTNATTALAGVGASYRFIPQATVFASAGVETDINTNNGTYSATGIAGLTPINFNPNPVRTRPTAMLGASYDIEKNQRLGIYGIYRQEPYQAVQTTTVMATYTVGF